MSYRILSAMKDLELPTAEKAVLTALAGHALHNGANYRPPSVATIGREAGYSSVRTTQNALTRLEKRDLIENAGTGGGRGRPTQWWICIQNFLRYVHPAALASLTWYVDEKGEMQTGKHKDVVAWYMQHGIAVGETPQNLPGIEPETPHNLPGLRAHIQQARRRAGDVEQSIHDENPANFARIARKPRNPRLETPQSTTGNPANFAGESVSEAVQSESVDRRRISPRTPLAAQEPAPAGRHTDAREKPAEEEAGEGDEAAPKPEPARLAAQLAQLETDRPRSQRPPGLAPVPAPVEPLPPSQAILRSQVPFEKFKARYCAGMDENRAWLTFSAWLRGADPPDPGGGTDTAVSALHAIGEGKDTPL
jgi:hypothetical protein